MTVSNVANKTRIVKAVAKRPSRSLFTDPIDASNPASVRFVGLMIKIDKLARIQPEGLDAITSVADALLGGRAPA
jgi:hypothetical protein